MQFSTSSGDGINNMHVVCTDLLCVMCIGLLSVKFSTVNIGLGG